MLEKPTFLAAVDEFYSVIESQRVDVSIMEQQKQALKKLENVKQDHGRRLDALRRTQEKEQLQARLIEENVSLVDRIIVYMRTLMAAELSWRDVAELLDKRRQKGDEVAEHVIKADIATNTVTILLEVKRDAESDEEGEEDQEESADDVIKVDINLNQSAFQNVTRVSDGLFGNLIDWFTSAWLTDLLIDRLIDWLIIDSVIHSSSYRLVDWLINSEAFSPSLFYLLWVFPYVVQNLFQLHTVKKQAAAKEHKTVEASEMALRNAERKTKQALKDVQTIGTITKARKTQWFEKFFWFISTENYLVRTVLKSA